MINNSFPQALRFIILSFLFLPALAHGQDITGIWRGYFVSDLGEQYKYELQIEQAKNNHITGVSYSYLDTRFYGKALLTGNFMRSSKSAMIQEIKTVEVKMTSGSETCIMKCMFAYAVSGKEEFLEGTYSSIYEKTANSNIVKGGGCGGGKVILRKVATTDFYVEPFLRKKNTQPPVAEKPKPERKLDPINKPIATAPKKQVPKKDLPHKNTTVVKPEKNLVVKEKRRTDTLKTVSPTTTIIVEKPIEKPHVNIPVVTRSRKNDLVETINVGSRDIYIRLYDNGEVDDDTISVYLDGKPLAMNRRLSTVPINLTIHLDNNDDEHTLVMYAENMGRIPPNTSLMIVQDGDKRYQVNITSTEQKNAMVRFRYQKKPE